jgi:stage IV sporulation protein B
MNSRQKRRYRIFLLGVLALDLGVMGWLFFRAMDQKIPDEIHVSKENTEELGSLYDIPCVTFSDAIAVSGNGSYQLDSYLFGIFPYKSIKVIPEETKEVFVSGDTIGVYLKTDGVLVVDTQEIVSENGSSEDPAGNVLKAGDYIVAVNDQEVENKDAMISQLEDLDGSDVTLTVRRDDETIPVSLTPVKDTFGEYKLGVWVRDDTQGIGTLTFVDAQGNYGALGHGISDVDTGDLLSICSGNLYQASVLGIVKGSRGNPGELSGLIRYDHASCLGDIKENTTLGIYGTLNSRGMESLTLQSMPVAYKQELTLGDATILACVDSEVKAYQAEITRIDLNHEDNNKSFVIHVTDEELLEKTGGIVQGMSGSPIVQNGKLVGAVTHVFVQDSTTGYGIFAENMLSESFAS